MRFSKLILFGLLLFGVPAAQAQNPLRPVFPTAVANDQTMGVACNSAHTTLLASIGSTSTSLSVNNSSQFCTPAWITIDGGTVNVEVIQICSAAGFTLNVCTNGRGVHGAAIGHSVELCNAGFRMGSMFPASGREWDSLTPQEQAELTAVVQAALDSVLEGS